MSSSSAPAWETDAVACTACSEAFTSFRRRHHCRRCGQLFCNDCSAYRAALTGFPAPQRLCGRCWIALQAPPESHADLQEALEIRNALIDNLKAALKTKSDALENCRSFLVERILLGHAVMPHDDSALEEDDSGSAEETTVMDNLLRQCSVQLEKQQNDYRNTSRLASSLKKSLARAEQAAAAKKRLLEDLQAQVAELQAALHAQTLRAAENHKLRSAVLEEVTAELNAERMRSRTLLANHQKRGGSSYHEKARPITFGRTALKRGSSSHDCESHWALNLRDPLICVHSSTTAERRDVHCCRRFFNRALRWLCCCCWCCRRRRRQV